MLPKTSPDELNNLCMETTKSYGMELGFTALGWALLIQSFFVLTGFAIITMAVGALMLIAMTSSALIGYALYKESRALLWLFVSQAACAGLLVVIRFI